MKKHKEPRNHIGNHHGYQEWYSFTTRLLLRCKYINGNENGYEEHHQFCFTNFYIK